MATFNKKTSKIPEGEAHTHHPFSDSNDVDTTANLDHGSSVKSIPSQLDNDPNDVEIGIVRVVRFQKITPGMVKLVYIRGPRRKKRTEQVDVSLQHQSSSSDQISNHGLSISITNGNSDSDGDGDSDADEDADSQIPRHAGDMRNIKKHIFDMIIGNNISQEFIWSLLSSLGILPVAAKKGDDGSLKENWMEYLDYGQVLKINRWINELSRAERDVLHGRYCGRGFRERGRDRNDGREVGIAGPGPAARNADEMMSNFRKSEGEETSSSLQTPIVSTQLNSLDKQ